jgi:elongator complex protein 1
MKLTPLRYANIPPPMCLHELQLAHEAQDISINSPTGVVAVLTNEEVEIFSQNPRKKGETPVRQGSISLSAIEGDPLQIVVTNDRLFLLVHGRDNIPRIYVSRIAIEDSTDLSWEQCNTDRPISSIFCDLTQDLVCAEAPDGEIYGLASYRFQSLPGKLPEYCPWVEVVQVGTKVSITINFYHLLIARSLYSDSPPEGCCMQAISFWLRTVHHSLRLQHT